MCAPASVLSQHYLYTLTIISQYEKELIRTPYGPDDKFRLSMLKFSYSNWSLLLRRIVNPRDSVSRQIDNRDTDTTRSTTKFTTN